MDFEKLADEFIAEGGWQGSPRIAVELFAKWLAEHEATQQERAVDGAMCPVCEFEQVLDQVCEEHGVYKITPRR